ncbi:solute carrier family 22 member 3 isoform X1 [Helicoverpa armigera]|uniref:solute carrier family 22 member 3 isoform X1 n=1 Tax=Helicoverpa armigera TaxID=29058 RepID=UPI0030834DB7
MDTAHEMRVIRGEELDAKQELTKQPKSDVDALELVLQHVGEMGRYQKLLFVCMMPFGFFFAYVYFVQMFIAATPQRHWCAVPELAHLDMELRRNLSAPGAETGVWDKCSTFDVNWTQVLQTLTPPPPGTPTIPCQHGWDFEMVDIPYQTVVTERGWVCENAGYVPMATAVFFAGAVAGGIILGWVADHFGRVPAIMGANLIGGIGGVATIFTTSVWDFVLCRFLVGMAFDNAFMMIYILVLEYISARHRTWVANISIAMYFGLGCVSLPWMALWISDWRLLVWVTSTPMFIVLLAPWVLPESARWYVSRGRTNQAVQVLRKFEKVNGTKIPDDVMDEFIVASTQTKQTNESLLVLMKSVPLRTIMILMLILYMSCAVVFDGLVRMSDAFGLDFFISFTLTSATEIPSVTLLAFVLDRWGRRNLTAGPLSIASVLIGIAIFVPKGIPQASMAIGARFFINMAYTAVIQWSAELLPTGVRASGFAALHISGYIASVLSPYIVFSERLWTLLPLLILGVVSVLGSGISMVLPETKGRPMPQTMADGERIVQEQGFCGSFNKVRFRRRTAKRDVEDNQRVIGDNNGKKKVSIVATQPRTPVEELHL